MISNEDARNILLSACPGLSDLIKKSYIKPTFDEFFEQAKIEGALEWVVGANSLTSNEDLKKNVVVNMSVTITIKEV